MTWNEVIVDEGEGMIRKASRAVREGL
ncbi:hypothetical protein M3J09_004119 [Ascochyta lentis]